MRIFQSNFWRRDLPLCLLAVFLLLLSNPTWDIWILAWIAIVPFFFAIENKRSGRAFFLGFISGVMFFGAGLSWLIHVTLAGMMLIVLYLAIYFGLFAIGYVRLRREKLLVQIIVIPSLWVVLEFIRAHLFTGFGWLCLGHSQYKNLPIIQISDLTGFYGVSFLVLMTNLLLKEWIAHRIQKDKNIKTLFVPTSVCVFSVGCAVIYGIFQMNHIVMRDGLKVSIVQANIAQELKWERSEWPAIMDRYLELTKEAVAEKPDLLIWPETAFPGFLWEEPDRFLDLKDFVAKINVPLVFGTVLMEKKNYYNSAILLSGNGQLSQQHNKLHLVPFGEYVPLRHVFPFLADIVPIGDFSTGEKYTIFSIPQPNEERFKNSLFGILICFEDTIPEISRKFVQSGARFLVNITNDAWFLDTAAGFMHLQASVFRTVENRRSLIRCANTGISCFINPLGKIFKYVEGSDGKKTFVSGVAQSTIPVSEQNTFYTKFGDVFTYFCFGCILGVIFRSIIKKKNLKTV